MEDKELKVGDFVVYDGLIGCIESISPSISGDHKLLSLVSVEDPELTCTAPDNKCTPYHGEEIDQSEALNNAYAESIAIQGTVGRITDKHLRDGCH
jgi:hypothetical protein